MPEPRNTTTEKTDKADKADKAGRTTVAKDGERAPRLPHEHDESSDSGTGAPRDVMRQAKEDLDSGKQPTDRGEATDAAYQQQKR